MKFFQRSLPAIVAGFLLLSAALAGGIGAAAAQEAPDEEDAQNATEAAQEAAGDEGGEEPTREVVEQVDSRVSVADWTYHEGAQEFEIEFRNSGDVPVTVTLTGMLADPEQSRISMKEVRIAPGETTVTIQAQQNDDDMAGVILATAESVRQGHATPIVYDQGPPEQEEIGLLEGVMLGIAICLVGTIFAAWRKVTGKSQSIESGWSDGGGWMP